MGLSSRCNGACRSWAGVVANLMVFVGLGAVGWWLWRCCPVPSFWRFLPVAMFSQLLALLLAVRLVAPGPGRAAVGRVRWPRLLAVAVLVLAGAVGAWWMIGHPDETWVVPLIGWLTLVFTIIAWLWPRGGAGQPDAGAPPPVTRAPDAGASRPPDQRLDAYLAHQRALAQRVDLATIFPDAAPSAAVGPMVGLADIYVPLRVAANEEAGYDPRGSGSLHQPRQQDEDRAQPFVDALANAIRAAEAEARPCCGLLLGDPGGGKSSVVGDILYRCAHPDEERPGWSPWPAPLIGRTPLRLNLKQLQVPPDAPADLSLTDAQRAAPFWAAVRAELGRRLAEQDRGDLPVAEDLSAPPPAPADLDAVFARLRERLARKGLLLLDGLDEIMHEGRRERARDLILHLARSLGPGCALLVTGRPYVYPRCRLPGFRLWELRPLGLEDAEEQPSQVRRLVRNWHRALGEPQAAEARLLTALAQEPARREMATRPLLLTLLIALGLRRRADGEALPADRAELLEQATALFVDRWLRLFNRDAGQVPPALVRELVDRELLRGVLERVALLAQHDRRAAGDATLTVRRQLFIGELEETLEARLADADAARRALFDRHRAEIKNLLIERPGLLYALGDDARDVQYAFVHRQFQEYLAACALVRDPPGLEAALSSGPAAANPGDWRELVRFAILRVARLPDPLKALALLRRLLRDDPTATDLDPRQWAALATAGLALMDLAPRRDDDAIAKHGPELEALKTLLLDRVQAVGDHQAPSPETRRQLGIAAGRLALRRPGVVPAGWTPDPTAPFALLPTDLAWVSIPPGRFTPGSDRDDPQAEPIEFGGEPIHLPGFEIARYPITNAQFAAFARAADGYGRPGQAEPPRCWWFARDLGADADADPSLDDAAVVWWRREGAERLSHWLDADRAADRLPGHPAIRTGWYEAMAFCRWLTLRWRQDGLLAADMDIRLPTEVCWERAARGPERPQAPRHRRWPWGDDWRAGAANTGDAGLETTTAVGLFPDRSSEQARDLAGNCWEWTATRWGPDWGEPAFNWPFVPGDGRNDPGGTDLRIIRGGSYRDAPRVCRAASRNRGIPDDWDDNLGFRVVRFSLAHPVF